MAVSIYPTTTIPKHIKVLFWYGKPTVLHKKEIITHILNRGTLRDIRWMLKTYRKRDIKESIKNPLPGEWDKKSFYFWQAFFNIPSNLALQQKAVKSLTL